jgi:hypothetical protein
MFAISYDISDRILFHVLLVLSDHLDLCLLLEEFFDLLLRGFESHLL